MIKIQTIKKPKDQRIIEVGDRVKILRELFYNGSLIPIGTIAVVTCLGDRVAAVVYEQDNFFEQEFFYYTEELELIG